MKPQWHSPGHSKQIHSVLPQTWVVKGWYENDSAGHTQHTIGRRESCSHKLVDGSLQRGLAGWRKGHGMIWSSKAY